MTFDAPASFVVGSWSPVAGCEHCRAWRGECPRHVSHRIARFAAARGIVNHAHDYQLVRQPVAVKRDRRAELAAFRARQLVIDFGSFDPRQRVLTFT